MFKSPKDTFTLSNGVKIPCIGFGMWQTPDGEVAVKAAKDALSMGYRHIDTAAGYGNEQSVGVAVRECGLPREDIFVTSKLQNTMHGYDNTMRAFEESMKKLDIGYMDLYLVHWPNPAKFRDEWPKGMIGTWKAFEELYTAKRIRSIGVSNFMPRHMAALEKELTIMPMVNQIRLCPGETQPEASAYCAKHNILLEAYSPLGTGNIFQVEAMQAFAAKYGKTIAQICIRWSLQMGYLPLPKSVTASRIQENIEVYDFDLSAEDVKAIADMTECCGPSPDPDKTSF